MSQFFSKMGAVWVKLPDGSNILMNDITTFITFSDTWRNDPRTQLQYEIKDGELPHQISYRLYDTVDYWWIVLLFNNIYDFENQWPRNSDQLDDYIASKYPTNSPDDVHHYMNSQGLVVDLLSQKIALGVTTDDDAIYQGNLTPVTIREYEETLNDNKRNINLLDPDYVGQVVSEFESLMGDS